MTERKKTSEPKREPAPAKPRHAKAVSKSPGTKKQASFLVGFFDALLGAFTAKKSSSASSGAVNAAGPSPSTPEAPLLRSAGSPIIPEFICPNTPLSGFSVLKSSPLFTKVLVVSVVAHIFLITMVTFSTAIRAHHDAKQTLQVALVNSKTMTRPDDAKLLAQANLDGGGNVDEDLQASTPLPAITPNDLKRLDAEQKKKREETERKVREVMTAMTNIQPEYQTQKMRTKSDIKQPNAQEKMDNFLKMVQLQAQIQKEWNEYQKRPKRTFIGSQAEEYRFAAYVEDWRLTIEEIGNKNYPEAARRLNLRGSLRMTVSIRSDGTVENATIDASSGSKILDAAALKIVDMGTPYKPFPEAIKNDTDILSITRSWTFTPSGFETRSIGAK